MTNEPITKTNALAEQVGTGDIPVICLLTGSSGCGKTYLCESLATQLSSPKCGILHFDSIGVPSFEEMVREYGSGEKWQEAKTHEWMATIAALKDKSLIIFEGQYHPQFAVDACRKLGISDFRLAVVTCDETVWEQRLRGPREQPHLVTDDMRNWARLLRQWTVELGGIAIDTSRSDASENMNEVANLINPLLLKRLNG